MTASSAKDSFRVRAHRAFRRLLSRALAAFGRFDWTAVLALAIMDRAFRQEARRTLAGGHGAPETHSRDFQIRRGIHRIEKGLALRPRRDTFALDYIESTTQAYVHVIGQLPEGVPWPEHLVWAHDVLLTFFETVDHGEQIDRARDLFVGAPQPTRRRSDLQAPKERSADPPPVPLEALAALARKRRSTRLFEPERVPRDLIDQALDVARQAPSGCNRQPFHVYIVDVPSDVRDVAALALGARGWAEEAPGIAVFVGDWAAFEFPRDRHLPFVDAGLAAMGFILAAESLGIATCPIHWPDLSEQSAAAARRLGLGPAEHVLFMIAYGRPLAGQVVPYSAKTELDRLRTFLSDA